MSRRRACGLCGLRQRGPLRCDVPAVGSEVALLEVGLGPLVGRDRRSDEILERLAAWRSPLDGRRRSRAQDRTECLLERVVPGDVRLRERLVHALLGTRTEQVPFKDGDLCLGQWQRIMLFSLDSEYRSDWSLTLVG